MMLMNAQPVRIWLDEHGGFHTSQRFNFNDNPMNDEQNNPTPAHYDKKCRCGLKLDPYRISEIYGHSGIQHHLAKKALCAGTRGHKDLLQDLNDIIATATRWKKMVEEDQPVDMEESFCKDLFERTKHLAVASPEPFKEGQPVRWKRSGKNAVFRRLDNANPDLAWVSFHGTPDRHDFVPVVELESAAFVPPAPTSGFAVGKRVRVNWKGFITYHGREGVILKQDHADSWVVDLDGGLKSNFESRYLELLPDEPVSGFAVGRKVRVKEAAPIRADWKGRDLLITCKTASGWVLNDGNNELGFFEHELELLPEGEQP